MSPEIYEFIKTAISALVGAGLTLGVVAKFGQSWFFKKVDAKYAIDLASKNNELMSNLEHKKNELNKELQIEVTYFKSQLEVLGSQKSKFLEKKINSILELNQQHYLAVKSIGVYTDITHTYVDEAMSYFFHQVEDGGKLSNYDVYRDMKEERWPTYSKGARTAFNKYTECLALNMPILPKELVQEEMSTIDSLRRILDESSTSFHRSMNFTRYIVDADECETTIEECMKNLKEEAEKTLLCKNTADDLSRLLFSKAVKSGDLIDDLLKHNERN